MYKMPDFNCDKCKYKTSHKGTFDNHLKSKRHLKSNVDETMDYVCTKCLYETNDSCAYAKHCKTDRHYLIADDRTEYECCCGDSFHSHKALVWHRKKCTFEPTTQTTESAQPTDQPTPDPPIDPTSAAAVSELTVITGMLCEIIKNVNNTTNNNTDNKQIDNKQITTNSHNTTNIQNNNNNFNVMLFLNEECADAVDFSDFIYDVEYTQKDLDRAMVAGSVVAISELITREVEKMPLRKRPFHCTDLKRKVLYIKEGHWMKDLGGCLPLYNMIKFFKGKEDRTRAIWSIAHDARVQQGYNSCYDYFIRVCDNTTIPFTECHMKKMCKAALEASILNRDII